MCDDDGGGDGGAGDQVIGAGGDQLTGGEDRWNGEAVDQLIDDGGHELIGDATVDQLIGRVAWGQ